MDEGITPATPPALPKRKGEGAESERKRKRKEIEIDEGGPSAAGEAPEWPMMIFTRRDGKSKLETGFRFASFDQTSSKAMGYAACSVIAAVNALWLLTNPGKYPTSSELDDLIMEGSAKWNLLRAKPENRQAFQDGHFDLETVLTSMMPLETVTERSFVGFFGTERLECLPEAMSFDNIWDNISGGAGVYVVSWNDHFFVMKAEEEALYVVDSLGARLYPGCKTGYMLKFDSRSLMIETKEGSRGEWSDYVFTGKDCCREFFKGFLAGTIVKNMARMARDWDYVSVCKLMQIEFHRMTAPSSPPNGLPPMECLSSGGDDNDRGGHDKSCPSAPTNEADSSSDPIVTVDYLSRFPP